jgi:hypothetical protein
VSAVQPGKNGFYFSVKGGMIMGVDFPLSYFASHDDVLFIYYNMEGTPETIKVDSKTMFGLNVGYRWNLSDFFLNRYFGSLLSSII